MKVDGIPFTNGPTCSGVAFSAPDATFDLSMITITGRYPENGWATNQESDELVIIQEGSGNVEFKDSSQALNPGDVVHVPVGKSFAWNGDMTLIMSCQPAFKPEQYIVEE